MTEMAILQEVDKCMRCNGCVVACKREWNYKSETIGVMKTAYDQRLAIKSQKRVDMGPFVRFSCWHCPDPPCAKACPRGAMVKKASGAVAIDEDLCRPDLCYNAALGQYPCVAGCQRGGYPKIGIGRTTQAEAKANKCTLCYTRAGSLDLTATPLPTRNVNGNKSMLTGTGVDTTTVYAELGHEPACVATCPAKSMVWDTRDNVIAYLKDPANGFHNGTKWVGRVYGNGSVFWASKTGVFAPPKADPLVEDHVAPIASGLLSSSLKVALPTLVVGGIVALSARRARIEEEASLDRGEV